MSSGSKDAPPSRKKVLMRFGPAPAVLGVVGAIAGGVAASVTLPEGVALTEHLVSVLGGVIFGGGAGFLFGLIGSMGWLGE